MTGRKKRKRKTKRKPQSATKKIKLVVMRSAKEAGHAPDATAANKRALLAGLSMGMGPGEAAEAIGVGRSTVFNWKKDDLEFAAKWEEARETAWDKLEGKMYSTGINGDVSAMEKTLKAFRPERWRETRSESTSTTNVTVRMSLEESRERLRQLGVEFPITIEGDQVEDHTIPLIEDHASGRKPEDT